MDEVIKYVCHDCRKWWAVAIPVPYSQCPYCSSENIGRVYLESEEAAILAALGALTFERDDARRWARRFYRLWKATQEPVTVMSKGRKAKGAK